MKKYLITGVSGFVAGYFLEHLDAQARDGEAVEVLGIARTIPPALNRDFHRIKLRLLPLDLLDYKALEIALVAWTPDCLVHFASSSSVGQSWQEPITSFINNTNIFLNVAEIVRAHNLPCRILSIGSSEEYGNVDAAYIPLAETAPLKPVSPYGVARVAQEMLSQNYARAYKLDIVMTRSFNHYGARQNERFALPSFAKQILTAQKDGREEAVITAGAVDLVRDFTDVRDVVRAYALLLEKGVGGEIYNVCSGRGTTLREIIVLLAQLAKVKVKIEIDAARLRPDDNKIIIGDNAKLSAHTRWSPRIELAAGLTDLLTYWREQPR